MSAALRVAVLGGGAIGGWLAASLAEAGCAVSLLARGETLAAVQRDGLRVTSGGQTRRYRLLASADATVLGPQDHVILAVKAQTLPAALPALAPLLSGAPRITSACNGIPWWFFQRSTGSLAGFVPQSVDPGARLADAIPPDRVIGCVVHAAARVAAPGQVVLTKAERLLLGAIDGAADPTVAALATAFAVGGVPCAATSSIRAEIWSKLWGNATMNPLSALTGATTGRMLGDPDIRALCLAMMHEMAAIGARIDLPLGDPEERVAVTRKLGDFKTSMLQDAEAGRPLELEPILGVLTEIGQELDLPVPSLQAVLSLARFSCRTMPLRADVERPVGGGRGG